MDMPLTGETESLTSQAEQRIGDLQQEFSVGLEELNQGKSVPGEQVFDELRRRSEEKSR